jgi:hypothetical protein
VELSAVRKIVHQPRKRHGEEMFERLLAIEVLSEGSDAAVRVYRCSGCDREMRLTVWAALPAPVED